MVSKKLTLTVHARPRKEGPLSADERKQLVTFFEVLMDLYQQETEKKKESNDANHRD